MLSNMYKLTESQFVAAGGGYRNYDRPGAIMVASFTPQLGTTSHRALPPSFGQDLQHFVSLTLCPVSA